MKKLIVLLIFTFMFSSVINAQSALKNSFGVRIGLVYWDGMATDFSSFYELQYNYKILKRIVLVGKFNTGSKNRKLHNTLAVSDKDEFLNSKFICGDNTSKNPGIIYSNYHSYGLGMKFILNQDIKSSIQVFLGSRQVYINEKSFSSGGSKLEYLRDSFKSYTKLGLEIGLSYDYKLTDIISLSSSAHFVSNIFLWEVNSGVNIWF